MKEAIRLTLARPVEEKEKLVKVISGDMLIYNIIVATIQIRSGLIHGFTLSTTTHSNTQTSNPPDPR